MPTLEERVRKLESRLGSGAALGLHSDASGLQDEVERLKVELGRLRTGQHSGNVFGGMIRTEIGSFYTSVGPVRQDVDASFPVTFDVVVPEEWLRIKYFRLRIKPTVIRSSVTVAEAISAQTSEDGGSQTSGASSASSSGSETTPSGGGDTSGSGGSHNHVGSTDSGSSTDHDHGGATSSEQPLNPHAHAIDEDDALHTHIVATVSTGSHQHSTPDHTHPTHSHGIAHTHDVDDHTHDVAGHGHDLTLAIAEGAQATQVEISIGGVDRTSELGGPWDAAAIVDIRQYLMNARQEPIAGVYAIELRSATVGAVEVWGEVHGVLKAVQ
jgi:hypothetical protein